MPTLLFRLNGVPDDEADAVRALLRDSRIDFYETPAGRWGISLGGIWLRDEDGDRAERARRLIEDYQQERTARAREAYDEQRRSGRHETLGQRLLSDPLMVIAVVMIVLGVLYLSIMPFLGLL
jgi:hypothetical protein